MIKLEWKWEELDKHEDSNGNLSMTARAKVMGGWIIHHTFQKKNTMSESMTFIPDHDHRWVILKAQPQPEVKSVKFPP